MPKALVDAARARGFPLYEVPYDTPFIAITERAFTRLVNEQYALLRRSIAAQERLQRIVLSERGLDAIVAAIAALVGGPALVFDGRGELEALHAFRRELAPETVTALGDELRERARRGEARGFVPADPDLAARALALPVGSPDGPEDGLPQAWLVAAKDTGEPRRDRPAHPAPGRHRHRARAAAPARRRQHRAPARGRRALRGRRRRP